MPTKLREGNVFTGVCLSACGVGISSIRSLLGVGISGIKSLPRGRYPEGRYPGDIRILGGKYTPIPTPVTYI